MILDPDLKEASGGKMIYIRFFWDKMARDADSNPSKPHLVPGGNPLALAAAILVN